MIQAILVAILRVAAALHVEAAVVAGATDHSKKGNSSAKHWLKGFPFSFNMTMVFLLRSVRLCEQMVNIHIRFG